MTSTVVVVNQDERLGVAVALLLLLVVVYLTFSLGLTLFNGIKRTQVTIAKARVFLAASFGFASWHYLAPYYSPLTAVFQGFKIVLNSCQPVILRLFGVGGQGFLHLGSLFFIDIAKLSFSEIAWRFAAGGYTTILTVIFLVPLLLMISLYLSPVNDAVKTAEERRKTKQSTGSTPTSTKVPPSANTKTEWSCGLCLCLNEHDATHCSLCEAERFEIIPPEKGENQANNDIDSDKQMEEDVIQRRPILRHFDMKAFEVLAHLGSGTAGVVTLAHISTTRLLENSSTSLTSLDPSQDDSLSIVQEENSPRRSKPNLFVNTSTGIGGPFLSADEQAPQITPYYPPGLSPRSNFSGPGIKKSASVSANLDRDLQDTAKGSQDDTWLPKLVITKPPPARLSPLRAMLEKAQSPRSLGKNKPISLLSTRAPLSPKFAKDIQTHISMKRASRSVPSHLDTLQESPVDEPDPDWWSSVKWVNKSDLDLADASIHFGSRLNGLSLGLSNSGLPVGEEGYSRRLQTDATTESDTDTGRWSRDSSNTLPDQTLVKPESSEPSLFGTLREIPELVAIKTMHKRKIAAMGMKLSAERERKVLGMINSPFVCSLFGAFQDKTWAYLILEPVPAGDLATLLEARSVMFEEEARFYVGCVLLATEHMHDRGIACLDIKPENMLIDQWGYLKICDLGIAKVFSNENSSESDEGTLSLRTDTACWEFTGTPEYMAPEVISTQSIQPGLPGLAGPDLWAVGILLYELITGATPFASPYGDNQETIDLIRQFSTECEGRDKVYQQSDKGSAFTSFISKKRSSLPADRLNEHVKEEKEKVLSTWFRDISSKSDVVIDLAFRLLRPNPLQRCISNEQAGPSAEGGAACRVFMEHPWFALCDGADSHKFEWSSLRSRAVYPPFIPDPSSLAPPFRGENVSVDITNEIPLTFAEFQAARDSANVDFGSKYPTSASEDNPWSGFIPISRPPLGFSNVERFKAHAMKIMNREESARTHDMADLGDESLVF